MTRILLARTDRIGDLVLSTPAIATVRKSFPQAHVTMVCTPYNRVVMERNTDIDELVDLVPGEDPARLGARFRGTLDLAIALAPRIKDLIIVGATHARERVGYTYQRRYLLRLLLRRYVNRTMISEADPNLSDRDPRRSVRHEVDQLLDLVALAGAHERVRELRLDLTPADRAAIAGLPRDPIVVHLGVRWFSRGSTVESTIDLIRELRRFGLPVVVTYAPDCAGLVAPIARERVADELIDGLQFHVWAAILENARVVVTVDTGATHVASALRRPIVVAFEHGYFRLNSQEWSPYGVPSVLVRKPRTADRELLAAFRAQIVAGVEQLLGC